MNCKSLISFITVSALVAGFTQTSITKAKTTNLGTVGETYPVVEPDVVAELQQDAATQNKAGNITQRLNQMKEFQPANIHKLPHAADDRTFLVSMDYTTLQDVVDAEGNILYPKGFTFNPLDHMSFPGGLVIIDGTDPSQIKWFQNTPYADNYQARLLLTDGYAYELARQLKRSVFYLTTDIAGRLKLTAVPAVVVQKGRNLQINEFKVDREKQVGNGENY